MTAQREIVLITGSTRGIGRALAGWLVQGGEHDVVIHGRRAEDVAAVVAQLQEESEADEARVFGVDAPLQEEAQVEAMFAQVEAHLGAPVSILVNNAGIVGAPQAKMHTLPTEAFATVMQTNLTGAYLCYKYAVQAMERAGLRGGKIINISSGITAGYTDAMLPRLGAYALSKHSVETFTRLAANEVYAEGIGVCCLSIEGSYRSGMTEEVFETEAFEKLPSPASIMPAFAQLFAGSWDEVSGKIFSSRRFLLEPELEWSTASPFVGVEMTKPYMLSHEKRKFLCSGESHVGPSPRVKQYLQSEQLHLERYPRSFATLELRRELARSLDVDATQIFVGNGITSCVESILQVFVPTGHHVLMHEKGWSFFNDLLHSRQVQFTALPFPIDGKEVDFALDEMASKVNAMTRLVYLTSPHNPTGRLLDPDKLKAFIEKIPPTLPVVIDECYVDYVSAPNPAAVPALLKETDHPIIGLRTLSKFHGLANLRIGYAIAHPQSISAIERYHLPWTVSDLNARCATEALRDLDYQRERREESTAERDFVHEGLDALGIDYVPTDSMMLLIKVPSDNFFDFRRKLNNHDIIITPFSFQRYFVYQIGSRKYNALLLQTLEECLAEFSPEQS